MELSIPALYKINQPYREIIDQYTNPCPLIAGHGGTEADRSCICRRKLMMKMMELAK